MAETNQTAISVVEPEDFVETVNKNVVDNPIVIPSEDVIATPPNDVGATGVPIHAAQRYIVDINGLIDTKSNHFTIVVKVMTLWEVPEVSKKNKVKCAKHEYKIVFMSNTSVEAAFNFDIPDHVFEFTPLAEVTNFVANFDYYFDLIGHIMAYSDPIVENGKKRISVELEDERADKLKVTLWGEHADQVTKYMSNNPPSPVVLIVQYVKCKNYYSKASVTTNLFNGKIYLDDMSIPDISEYKDSDSIYRSSANETKAESIQKISMLSQGSGYASYEEFINGAKLLSLGDIDDLDEAGYVVIFGKIIGLAKEYEWSYIGCRDCNKKVEEIEKDKGTRIVPSTKGRNTSDNKKFGLEKKWFCGNHGPLSAVGPKFKLQVYAIDATGSKILTLWDRVVYNFINKSAEKLRKQAGKDYPKVLDEIVGKKCLFRLDVSRYNIRNSSSEISIARLTTDAEMIKKYIDDVSEDQTAVSCTGDTEIGNLADDMADSPPPKNKSAGSCGEDSVKSNTNKRILSSNLASVLRHVGKEIKIDFQGNRYFYANIHITRKRRCQLYGSALEAFFQEFGISSRSKINLVYHRSLNVLQLFHFNYDGCERIHPDVNARTGNRYLLRLDHGTSKQAAIKKCFFNGIDWPSNQTTAKCVDVKRNQWEFMIMKENNEPVGFEGRMWEEFHDYYYNRIKCVNVIVIYTGNLYFYLRLFNNEGYYCNLDIVDSDTSEGEVDTLDYLCSNGDPNTFSAVTTDTEIPWHIVRRLKLDDYTNAILYYDGVLVINMHRVVTNDNPHRFVIEGDIKYMVDLKKIPLENFIMVNCSAKEARLFMKDLLKAKRLSLQSRRRNKQTMVISTVHINDAVTGKDARFTRKQILKGQLDEGTVNNSRSNKKEIMDKKRGKPIKEKQSVIIRGGVFICDSSQITNNISVNDTSQVRSNYR
ncbi:OLC1v1006097C1 [Oldenlandia corymbosa var. corymbosa]|uniref:OLC1v1006097C1 n=1 Tax=Oldenlandia corymbosa var. corymbosa TaxID=529605 RepID=A0AAV1DJ73_OLDCO|nr:OLC1v1006097C1 [Oldenlandia corymbosa var. corymbosa]